MYIPVIKSRQLLPAFRLRGTGSAVAAGAKRGTSNNEDASKFHGGRLWVEYRTHSNVAASDSEPDWLTQRSRTGPVFNASINCPQVCSVTLVSKIIPVLVPMVHSGFRCSAPAVGNLFPRAVLENLSITVFESTMCCHRLWSYDLRVRQDRNVYIIIIIIPLKFERSRCVCDKNPRHNSSWHSPFPVPWHSWFWHFQVSAIRYTSFHRFYCGVH